MQRPNIFKPVSKSSRKIAEAEAQKAKALALFQSIGEGALATDIEGKIYQVNKAALEIIGLDKAGVIGKWLPNVLIEQDEEGKQIHPLERHLTRAFLTGKRVSGRTFYKTPGRNIFPASVTISPVMLDERPIGSIAVIRDITNEFEVDKMKGEFISIASHQLRTPVTAIKTYAHLLASGYTGALNPDQQEFMQTVIDSADRMNELISTLLNISRIEMAKIIVEFKPTNLTKLVEKTVAELEQQASKQKVKIIFNKPADFNTVKTDPFLVREVFNNLITNAVKYSPKGGKVTVELVRDQDKYIKFSVTDKGYGIAPGERKKIFTKFYRAPDVQQETEGSGLGLYLVQLIAKTMGAKVSYTSQKGKGSTFYFIFPFTAVANQPK